MMAEVNCPYCGHENDIETDDGAFCRVEGGE